MDDQLNDSATSRPNNSENIGSWGGPWSYPQQPQMPQYPDQNTPMPQYSYPPQQYGYPQQPNTYYPQPVYPQQSYFPSQKTNGLAIVAFILSFFISILGIILGHIAIRDIRLTGERGDGLAWTAITIGWVCLILQVLILIQIL